MHSLENQLLCIKIHDKGAELHSIYEKKEKLEYLWQGDEKFWPRHAPVLFPIVGKVNGNVYKVCGMEYSLPQHGLARDLDFKLIEEDSHSLLFELAYSEETLKVYPYKFKFRIGYQLTENTLKIKYRVINQDDRDIYFSLGAHPGFNCPLYSEEKFEDYYLEFEENESVHTMCLNEKGYFKRETKSLLNNEKKIALNYDLFKDDALVFKNLKSQSICLKGSKNSKGLEVNFKGFPFLGIWTKNSGAPFVCIEPWYGHADFEDFNGEFKDKSGIVKLEKGKDFNAEMSISIL